LLNPLGFVAPHAATTGSTIAPVSIAAPALLQHSSPGPLSAQSLVFANALLTTALVDKDEQGVAAIAAIASAHGDQMSDATVRPTRGTSATTRHRSVTMTKRTPRHSPAHRPAATVHRARRATPTRPQREDGRHDSDRPRNARAF